VQSADLVSPVLSSGPFLQRAFIGGVHPGHLLGPSAFVGMVDHRQPRHGAAERGRVRCGRNAEGLLPAECRILDRDLEAAARVVRSGPRRAGRPIAGRRRGRGPSC
jgi:hypothetical protein